MVAFTRMGALAQFSRLGIVRKIAAAITAQFTDNLQRKMGASGEAVGRAASAGATKEGTEPVLPDHHEASASIISGSSGKGASLNLRALLWQLLVQRFRRLFQ